MLVAEQFELDQIFSKLSGLARVALAVSGGSDSVAMLRMVHEWAHAQNHPLEIFVLTVDHGLRNASADEALQVAKWCSHLTIKHQLLRWEHGGVASGVQAKARVARYDLMTNWCLAQSISVLLTAHTADDQAETVAMRRARTDSLQSIAGIWPEREWNGVTVMRPLLQVRRSELRNYLQGLGQPWLEDPSNDDRRFERVRIRQDLAGELGNFGQQANAAQEIVKRAALAVKEWCDINLEIHPTGFLTVRRSAISKLASDELDLVIIRLIEFCGSSIRKVELEERIKLQSWLREAKPARRTLGGALFAKRQDVLICAREPGRISKIPAIIQDGQNLNWDGRFTLNGPAGASVVPLRDIGPIPRCAEMPAFVQAGLPAIVQNGEIWSIPHLGIGNDVFVKFLRH